MGIVIRRLPNGSQQSTASARPEVEIHSQRTFPVARRTLFAAFENPEVLATWWGPRGSVNSFETFDLRAGGEWLFVMHAPDGTSYPMSNQFLEVVPPERIVLRHRQAGHEFELHMCYDAVDSAQTRLRWCMRFESAVEAARVRAIVSQANEENFDRLEGVVRRPSGSV